MREPIYIDDLEMEVVMLDESSAFASIRANDVGVAGDVSLEIIDGITLRTDFADPNMLVGIEIEVSGLHEEAEGWQLPTLLGECLEALIGPEATVEVERILSRREYGIFAIRGTDGPVEQIEPWRRKGHDAVVLGRALELLDIAEDPEQLAGVRLLSACEATGNQLEILPSTLALNIVRAAENQVLATMSNSQEDGIDLDDWQADLEELSERDPKLAREVADRVIGRSSLAAETKRELAQLLRGKERVGSEDHRQQRSSESTPQNTNVPDSGSDTPPTVEEVSPGRLIVEWKLRPSGEQLRVLSRNDLSLLAVAPVVQIDSVWRAEVIFPLDRTPSDLLLGSTSDPFPVVARTAFDQMMDAVSLGRLAVLRAKSEDFRTDEVQQAWLRCADAWEQLGDMRRRDLARDFSSRRSPKRDRFITDIVRMRLENVGGL